MFPGNPHDHSPCSSTPAGPSTRYGTKGQRTRHGPRTKAQRGLPTIANFGAQSHGFWSRCLRLEVEVTRHRARLASGCWSQLCRTGFDPQGFYERFLNWNSSSFPELHGASFVLALFHYCQPSPFGFTGHWRLATILSPLATIIRRPPDQRGQVVRRPSPAGYCLTLTAELSKTERGPISPTKPLPYFSPTRRFRRTNHPVSENWYPANRHSPLPVCLPFSCGRGG